MSRTSQGERTEEVWEESGAQVPLGYAHDALVSPTVEAAGAKL